VHTVYIKVVLQDKSFEVCESVVKCFMVGWNIANNLAIGKKTIKLSFFQLKNFEVLERSSNRLAANA
jgi:hypothetical protein